MYTKINKYYPLNNKTHEKLNLDQVCEKLNQQEQKIEQLETLITIANKSLNAGHKRK